MATMTTAQKNTCAKEQAVSAVTLPETAEQVGDFTYAIPVDVEGEERWVTITFVAKANKATKVNPAYDPFQQQADWQFEKQRKAAEAEAKMAAKSKKIARDKAAREKRAAEKAQKNKEMETKEM